MTSKLIILIAIAWALQLALTLWQTRRFYRRLYELRRDGRSAIGMAGSIYRGRIYVILVVSEDNIIRHAEKLSGWTVFASLRPVPILVGKPLDLLLKETDDSLSLSKKEREAFLNAANNLLEFEQEDGEDEEN
ncbi:MAG: transcriptional regulator [Chloroflexi bacterium]|nr:transcriptional regulator [Chloroflexota bacterium]